MNELEELKRKFKGMLDPDLVFPGKVMEVTGDTCTVERDEMVSYYDVRIKSVVGDNGLIITPRVGSVVLVCRIGVSNELFVCQYSDIEKIDYKCGKLVIGMQESGITIDCDSVVINGGDNGGMVKIEELNKNLDSLKRFCEAMHAALPGAFSAVGAAMASNGALGSQAYSTSMTGKVIQIGAMDNDKLKH